MRKYLIMIVFAVAAMLTSALRAQEVTFSGAYQGEDLYIYNPITNDANAAGYGDETFCISEVLVNGNKYPEVITSSAFNIDMGLLGIGYGDEYKVVLKHDNDCMPELINREILKPISSFKVSSFSLSDDKMFTFSTTGETGKLKFIIEEQRWSRWMKVGEVDGLGGPDTRTYTLKTLAFAGKNKFRVYQVNYKNEKRCSDELEVEYKGEPIVITSKKAVKTNITFSGETAYLVINKFGDELISGTGDNIDVSTLPKGKYFVAYENTYTKFKKKK